MRRALVLAAIVVVGLLALSRARRDPPPPAAQVARTTVHPIAPAPTSPAILDGEVRGPGGPIAGAVVCATEADETAEPRCAASGADGRFRFAVPAAALSVTTVASGFSPSTPEAFELHAGELRTLAVRLTPGGFVFHGTVEDGGGGPVIGARITARWDGAVLLVESDASGAFAVPSGPGLVTLLVRADGYVDLPHRLDAPAPPHTFRLTPAGQVIGLVVDGPTGQPVAGARVTAWGSPPTLSDGEGRFRFANLVGTIPFSASTADRYGSLSETVSIGRTVEVELRVWPAPTLDATVTTDAGKPCPSGWVRLGGYSTPHLFPIVDGRVEARAVPFGDYAVWVDCPGFLAGTSGVPVLRVRDRAGPENWKIEEGVRVRGVVLDGAGLPAGRALVRARPLDLGAAELVTETAEDGTFRWESVPPARFVFSVQRAGTGWNDVTELDIRDTTDLTLRLPGDGWLDGTVSDQDGAALAEVGVVVLRLDSGSQVWTRTDRDGRFSTRRGLWLSPADGADTSLPTRSNGRFASDPLEPGDYQLTGYSAGRRTELRRVQLGAGETRDLGDLAVADRAAEP